MSGSPVVAITGGASGIGAACAALFAERGWTVHVLDLSMPDMSSDDVSYHRVDVTDESTLLAAAGSIGSLDCLVTAAGVNLTPADASAYRLELGAWDRTLAINLTGTMLAVRAFFPNLLDGAAVVTLGSTAGISAMAGQDAYTASKGAVVSLTRSWAIDFSKYGVRANCVCPGPTETAMLAGIVDGLDAHHQLVLPQQRPATAREIAEVIVFAGSPASSYLSGAVIPVDGGATANTAGMPFPRRRTRSVVRSDAAPA
jgi:NAD(P)-dependent dehydrogenase (short-subunit alcohol dehydrogenase family)